MKHITIITLLLVVACPALFAQTEKQPAKLNLEGQIALTTNGEALFFNMGGPSLRFNFPKFAFGATMFPSLKSENKASKIQVTPLLGVGPQICFLKDKRLIVEFPCYYSASKAAWTVTIGVGYILTKPKKQ
jgi:hypothetical protein